MHKEKPPELLHDYKPKNIAYPQWVHKKINQIKMDLPDNEFVFLCHLIAENNTKPSNFDSNCITSKSTKYDKIRNKCICGNPKIKKAKRCKSCYMS